jgi:predicted GNAT family N-acyltransferase
MVSAKMQIVELGRLSLRDWAEVVDGEPAPFGEICAGLEFQPKDHHIGVRDDSGALVAAAGWTVVTLEIEGRSPFKVIGIGALIVRRDLRRSGLAGPIMDLIVERSAEMGLEYRMLFCEPPLEALYRRRGYELIADPVWVHQRSGLVRSPLLAMWRSVRPGGAWPAGSVRVHGLPF